MSGRTTPRRIGAHIAAALVIVGAGVAVLGGPATAEAKRGTTTKIKRGDASSIEGRVKRASKGRTRVKVKQVGVGVVSSDIVRVRGSSFEFDYDSLAAGTYSAKARYLGSRSRRPSRAKTRKFAVGPAGCPLPDPDQVEGLESFKLTGCPTLASDTGEVADPRELWGRVDCGKTTAEDVSRAKLVGSSGDSHVMAEGTPQGDDAHRRLTTFDGDDHWGERCELGKHEHRYGSGGGEGTFQLYEEGQRAVTMLSLRFPENFELDTTAWQTVIQMKQTAPSAGSGDGPQLEVQAREGKFWLGNAHSDLWQARAPDNGVWTRLAFDVRYSQDPKVGFIKMYVDSNGDGDAADAGEQSPTFHVATLKREIAGGSPDDGIAPGESIPSALRTGIYHNPEIPCPPPDGCSIDVDNVQVLAAG